MWKLQILGHYVKWLVTAKTRQGIHSPFVYSFLDNCLYKKSDRELFMTPENQRSLLKKNTDLLQYIDPGAGSRILKTPSAEDSIRTVKVNQIARTSLQKTGFCALFFRMIKYFNYKNILELGTSLGVTTSYLSLANPDSRIDTIEGAAPVAQMAENYFKNENFSNIHVHVGNFDDILQKVIDDKTYDMVIIDGNHKGEKVLRYFQKLVKHTKKDGVIIIDDIRWSASMYNCWKQVMKHPQVNCTLDLFQLGLVFFKPGMVRQNFTIRF
ncbi:MAG: class I SAM-dependent methyltransferase [Bacteroidetes bacterium]|nr:MAG: class I SAM-dependent methyltransferase [Bacteroidota bacterium]